MGRDAYIHSVAKVFLKKLGNKITINGKDFFDKIPNKAEETYSITPLRTQLEVGTRLIDEKELPEMTYISFPDLRRKYGLTIYKIPITKELQWYKSQQAIYVIANRTKGVPGEIDDAAFSRHGFKLEFDVKSMRVRGIGEGFGTVKGKFSIGNVTPLIPVGEEQHKGDNLRDMHRYENYGEVSNLIYETWSGREIVEQPIKIKELPVMVIDDGKSLLCIPKDKEKVPKILIVGKSRKGKTFSTVSILSRIPYIFGDEVGICNDMFSQFEDCMIPQDNTEFIYKLNRIGEEPKPLPIVNLYLSGPDLDIRYNNESAGFRLVVDIRDFCFRYPYWSYGVGKWDLGKAIKYMSADIVHQVSSTTTAEQVKDILYSSLQNPDDLDQMIFKWKSAFEQIYRDQFTSNMFINEPSTSPVWTANITVNGKELEFEEHPFIVCLYSGMIPVLNNSTVKDKPITPKMTVDLLNKILLFQDRMKNKGTMKRIWLVWDELRDLFDKKNKEVYAAFEKFFTQAAFRLAGGIVNVQEYSILTPAFKNNTDYMLVFALQTSEERNAIAKDFECKDEMMAVGELKLFECLFVAKEKVVIYDVDGRRREEYGGLWKGVVLPPLCTTRKPSTGVST